jgi:hypothetical protein
MKSEQGLVHLKVRGLCEPLSATPHHWVWAIKSESKRCPSVGQKWDRLLGHGDVPQWIPADFLSPGDYVHIPVHRGYERPITPEQAWMYGLYLAEGSTLLDAGVTGKHNRITLTMNERELPMLERFATVFAETFGKVPRVFYRQRQGVTSELVVSPGRDICLQFRTLFGHRAEGKRLPDWMFDMEADLKKAGVSHLSRSRSGA